MTEAEIRKAAEESGFTTVAALDPATLKFLPEVRSMCAANRCRSYNKNWACPPACGTLEEWQERLSHYSKGILLQTIGDIEDSYDIEAMMEVAAENKKQSDLLIERLLGQNADFIYLSAGACIRCENCTWPDAPCRFPEKTFPSMEAAGLFVSQVCKDNDVLYNYGNEKIAYTCCVLFNE